MSIPEVGAILGLASFGGRTVLVAATTDPDGELDRSMVFTTDSNLDPTD